LTITVVGASTERMEGAFYDKRAAARPSPGNPEVHSWNSHVIGTGAVALCRNGMKDLKQHMQLDVAFYKY